MEGRVRLEQALAMSRGSDSSLVERASGDAGRGADRRPGEAPGTRPGRPPARLSRPPLDEGLRIFSAHHGIDDVAAMLGTLIPERGEKPSRVDRMPGVLNVTFEMQ
jgi:hypothetical protein